MLTPLIEGPLDFPLTDKQTRNFEAILQMLGKPDCAKSADGFFPPLGINTPGSSP